MQPRIRAELHKTGFVRLRIKEQQGILSEVNYKRWKQALCEEMVLRDKTHAAEIISLKAEIEAKEATIMRLAEDNIRFEDFVFELREKLTAFPLTIPLIFRETPNAVQTGTSEAEYEEAERENELEDEEETEYEEEVDREEEVGYEEDTESPTAPQSFSREASDALKGQTAHHHQLQGQDHQAALTPSSPVIAATQQSSPVSETLPNELIVPTRLGRCAFAIRSSSKATNVMGNPFQEMNGWSITLEIEAGFAAIKLNIALSDGRKDQPVPLKHDHRKNFSVAWHPGVYLHNKRMISDLQAWDIREIKRGAIF